MTASILYLIPDTNVFIECKALENVDWHALEAFDDHEEIRLVICSEVRRELDNLKTSRSNRVSKRAREANARIRRLILSDDDCETVRDKAPSVLLCLGDDSLYAPTLDGLDLSQADDRIVGYTAAYAREHPDADVFMLTDDIGPMGTARQTNVPFQPVPTSWRRVPERDDRDKEILALKKRIAELEATEPQFDMTWDDSIHNDNRRIVLSATVWQPLSASDIRRHIKALQQLRLPNPTIGPAPIFRGIIVPTRRQYDEWTSECKEVLEDLHVAMQYREERPALSLHVTNAGACPGADVLVTISTEGNFKLCIPRNDQFDPMDAEAERRLSLPPPPKPRGILDALDTSTYLHPSAFLDARGYFTPPPRNPNKLYYWPESPVEPVASIARECQQWRHKSAAKVFMVEVFVADVASDVEGAIKCRIEAGNLSDPIEQTFPLRIAVQPISSNDAATDVIDRYLKENRL